MPKVIKLAVLLTTLKLKYMFSFTTPAGAQSVWASQPQQRGAWSIPKIRLFS